MSDFKVDNMHYFELMDRASIILSNVDQFLIQNPGAKTNKSIAKKLNKVGELLAEVYSESGAIFFENSEKESGDETSIV